MLLAQWMAIATLSTLPLVAVAQEKPKQADPSNPAAAGSAPVYESVFSSYKPSSEADESQEEIWRAVNNEMGRLGGHVGHVRETPATPVPTTKDMSQSEPVSAGHGEHHQKEGK